MALGDEPRDFGRDLTQFDAPGTVMRTAEEDKPGGASPNGGILGVFLGIEQRLSIFSFSLL